jgi:hypothetical protein
MFGLILIALGVLFLLKNLGIISGSVWDIFLAYSFDRFRFRDINKHSQKKKIF